jgi:hypothetical protein
MAPPKGKTKTPAGAAVLKKAAAGSKTTGETESDYPPAAPVRVVLKTFGLLMYDKYAVSEYAEGSSDFYEIKFYANGAPRGRGISCNTVGGRVHSQVELPHRRISLHNGAPQVHHG